MPLYSDEKTDEKIKNLHCTIRARDERIVALETENAMLYLKLAQAEGNSRQAKIQSSHLRCLYVDSEKSRQRLQGSLITVMKHVKVLQEDLKVLRNDVCNMPKHWSQVVRDLEKETRGYAHSINVLASEHLSSSAVLRDKLKEAQLGIHEAMMKANEERMRRRLLHNALVELRGNIRVYCRVRPLLAMLDSNNNTELLGIPNTSSEQIVNAVDDESICFNQQSSAGTAPKVKQYEFERVYKQDESQEVLFFDVAPLLISLLDGYNVCVMAYGQTGSGKTHTMLGDHEMYNDINSMVNDDEGMKKGNKVETEKLRSGAGIIPRSVKELFKLIKERESKTESYHLEVCVFEVYNNEIIDLLAPPNKRDVKHNVFTASDGSQEIPSLTTQSITSSKELMDLVMFGLTHRHEDSTKIHAHSSRSHLIVQLNLYHTTLMNPDIRSEVVAPLTSTMTLGRNSKSSKIRSKSPMPRRGRSPVPRSESTRDRSPSPPTVSIDDQSHTEVLTLGRLQRNNKGKSESGLDVDGSCHNAANKNIVVIKTKLQLVDLAGSECVGMSGVTGSALRETSNINKSLSALADVLQALSEHQSHIPYRNTRLTHILQDTIGGDAKLLIMLCVSPARKYATESQQCLGFGSRARQVARGPAKKRRPTACSGAISPASSSIDISPLVRSSTMCMPSHQPGTPKK